MVFESAQLPFVGEPLSAPDARSCPACNADGAFLLALFETEDWYLCTECDSVIEVPVDSRPQAR